MAQSQRELGKEVFKSLADASSNMIWVNVGGQVVYANRACLETLGYSLTEMTAQGFDVLALVAPEDRQAIADSMKAFAEGRDVPPCEVTLVTRDGGHVRVLQNTVVVLIEGERAVLGVLTDVTGLRAAERQQALLAEVSGLAAGLERAELFYSEAVSMIARQLEFPLVAIERYDREAQQMVFLAAKGHSAGKKIQRVPVSDSISGTVATAGKAVALTRADQRKDYADKELRKDNVKTFACVPISEGGQVWGVLSLGDPEERALTASLMDTLDILASTIGALGRRLEDRERLSENRVRLEEIFKLTNDMLMLSELEAPGLPGKFVRVNDKMIDQLGYAERELLELGPPDIGEKVRLGNMGPVMKELWEEGSAISNSVFVTKDGAKIPVEISMAVVSRGEPGLFVAVARALDQGPEGVRAAEERYRALVEVQTDPLLVHKRGRILYANQAAADLFQVSSAADLLGKNVPDMIHPSDSERLRSAMESYEGTGVNSGVDDEVILRDGTKVQLEVASAPITYDGDKARQVVIHDVTESKKREVELRLSRDQNTAVLEAVPDLILFADDTGRVIRGNEAAIKILNLSAQTLGGRDLRTLETGRGRTLSDLIDRVRETGQTGRAEVELVRDGKSFPAAVTVSLAPVMQRARKPGFVVTAQDLTDRKAGEESLRIAYRSLQAAEKQLLETSRLLTVSQMAAGLAHELSHPLTGIKGFAQVALVRVGDDAPVTKELERIVEQADAMRDIMERVAGFSDTAAADRGTVNVNDVAGDIPRLLEALRAASGADISLELADPGPVVSGDPLQLTQAVVAIVANSLESLIGSERDGGKISIRTGRDAAFATVVVEDNGSGVPPEVADRIFEPFFTTKKKQGGTGLGLSMAARIIESHGGAVRVAKGDLGGAAFVVSLPVASPDAAKS